MTTLALPAALVVALGHMHRPVACPEEIRARIGAIRVPADDGAGRVTTSWRASAPPPSSGYGHHGHGHGHGYGRGGGSRAFGGNRPSHSGMGAGAGAGAVASAPPPSYHRYPRGGASAAIPRYGNRARTDATVEERMLDRIRDKMNKFSEITYDATYTWLTQLLNSGETEFLTGFITLVFEKAAEESHICALYARLIAELRTSFPHLETELRRIFGEFIAVFDDAAEEPEVGSAQYEAFVAQRKRRQYRQGYASFIAESARRGALTAADVFTTAHHILVGLETTRRDEAKKHLTEEYADCLKGLIGGCKDLLRADRTEMFRLVARIGEAKERAPGLTNKARFALMDLEEMCGADL